MDVLVSSIGEVFIPSSGVHKAHWTFGYRDKDGYLIATINGKKYKVHRLVARTFIGPNPDNKPEINHLNRNRDDNRCENISWCTRSENMRNTLHNDRVSARGEKHFYDYEDKKQYVKEKNILYRKTHRRITFSDGKIRCIPNSEALELCKLPVKDRVWHPHR